ncbi:hypothetical protein FEM48_Zijuj04G0152600 [Ziziphus jujuba var. spinosa]|uniref:Uncharacterized protein n=1 Tax=Ziziphus jujuba var. spinosa TaxID=714518 RepID=A0A978VKL6_ZIZJJ|nr:hypothetical protein FEM48_Zijuj04G0152600 [Ziziphus jujuba var. spinosa]
MEEEDERVLVRDCKCYPGYNIVCKVALDKGMSQHVLVVHGIVFGTLATALLALSVERFSVINVSLVSLDYNTVHQLLHQQHCNNHLDLFYHLYLSSCIQHQTDSPLRNYVLENDHDNNMLTKDGKIRHHKAWYLDKGGRNYCRIYWCNAHDPIRLDNRLCHARRFILSNGSILNLTDKNNKTVSSISNSNIINGLIRNFNTSTAILDHKASSWRLSWNITLFASVYSVRI